MGGPFAGENDGHLVFASRNRRDAGDAGDAGDAYPEMRDRGVAERPTTTTTTASSVVKNLFRSPHILKFYSPIYHFSGFLILYFT